MLGPKASDHSWQQFGADAVPRCCASTLHSRPHLRLHHSTGHLAHAGPPHLGGPTCGRQGTDPQLGAISAIVRPSEDRYKSIARALKSAGNLLLGLLTTTSPLAQSDQRREPPGKRRNLTEIIDVWNSTGPPYGT
jgi:hypothetical protein